MNNERNERIVAIYTERNSLGIAYFNCDAVRIQCSCIRNICKMAYHLVYPLMQKCTTILTNNLYHDLFAEIELKEKPILISEKILERDIIEHNLAKISSHMTSLANPKAYFQKMSENKLTFHSLGILLYHLLNQPNSLIERHKFYLDDVEYFNDTLLQMVRYGKGELDFLEITKEDIHPSLIKGKGHSKEGYSILSAYESYLISTGSKRILRYLFMNPTFNKEVLLERYEIIDWMKQEMRDSAKYSKYFRNIHVLETNLKKFGRMNVEEEDWKKFMKTLESMLQLRKLLVYDNIPKIIKQYVDNPNWDELAEVFNVFSETIDFNPFGIKSGIDQTLDNLKQTYDNMPHLLTIIAKEQEWGLDFRIVFMTQVGYLIKIRSDIQLPQEFDSEEWILQFSNGSGKYYSNELTLALDQQYGDVFGQIQDIEKKIIFDLEAMIIERQALILQLYWKICQIQCFWGVSQLSKNMCKPKLSSQSLIISNGWHFLLTENVIHNHGFSFCQTQAPKHQVYNSEKNIVNMNYSNRCMIITGPNASGKTVYMKQLGIIVYLAHLGFFVPASFAQIPLIDSILFVGKSQSIYNDQQCGFYSQLKSLSSITQPNIISNKSLVLIDEMGSEVDYQHSLKLIYTTIEYLTNKNDNFCKNRIISRPMDEFSSPIVIIVTHLSEILSNKIITENYMIRFLTMAVAQEGIRLFKIKPGLVSKGYGIRAAKEIMPPHFIELSKRYLTLINQL